MSRFGLGFFATKDPFVNYAATVTAANSGGGAGDPVGYNTGPYYTFPVGALSAQPVTETIKALITFPTFDLVNLILVGSRVGFFANKTLTFQGAAFNNSNLGQEYYDGADDITTFEWSITSGQQMVDGGTYPIQINLN